MQKMSLNLICRTAVIGIVFLRYTMTDLARMDFLAIRRSLYYLFQIFLNVSLLWMHGETNGQWLALKKAVAERECQLSLEKERSSEKKDGLKDKEKDSSKDVKRLDKSEKKKESTSSGQAEDSNKKEKNGNGLKGITTAEEKGDWMRRIMDRRM